MGRARLPRKKPGPRYGLIGAHVVLGLAAWGEGAEDRDGYTVPKAARMHFYKALLLLSKQLPRPRGILTP